MTNKSKRTKSIKIRLTDEEHQILLNRSADIPLAEWLRNLGLGSDVRSKRRRKLPDVDPNLLFHLAKIGTNINQIARVVNQTKDKLDKVWLLTVLHSFRNILSDLREDNKYSDS